MKKLFASLALLLISGFACSETTKTVFSPFTGKLDFITSMGGSSWPGTNASGCLSNDGSGTLSWAACSGSGGTPGSPLDSVQFNSGGSFAGSSSFTVTASSIGVMGISSFTFSGVSSIISTGTLFDVTLSSMVMGPTNLNGSYGTAGQFYTSAGSGSTPTWTTSSGSQRFPQIVISSISVAFTTTNSTWVIVANSTFTVTSSSASSIWTLSFSGTSFESSGQVMNVTVFKDNTNLCDVTYGCQRINGANVDISLGGFAWAFPNDTSSHTYKIKIRSEGGGTVYFGSENSAYMKMEETIQP